MLVLGRKLTERVDIGDDVVVTVLEIHGNKARIGIDAPKETHALRSEVLPSEPSDVGLDIPDRVVASVDETLPDATRRYTELRI